MGRCVVVVVVVGRWVGGVGSCIGRLGVGSSLNSSSSESDRLSGDVAGGSPCVDMNCWNRWLGVGVGVVVCMWEPVGVVSAVVVSVVCGSVVFGSFGVVSVVVGCVVVDARVVCVGFPWLFLCGSS